MAPRPQLPLHIICFQGPKAPKGQKLVPGRLMEPLVQLYHICWISILILISLVSLKHSLMDLKSANFLAINFISLRYTYLDLGVRDLVGPAGLFCAPNQLRLFIKTQNIFTTLKNIPFLFLNSFR